MTTLSEFRYVIKSQDQITFYVIDSFGQSIVKILNDLETAEDWRDYYNDLDKQDMWRLV
jgi:ethanolamine utilization cobalamin adenosyltransferase